jgi:hypothetical protein
VTSKHLPIEKEAVFPNLRREEYLVTSTETPDYNCIAHAAGFDDNWWWPDGPPSYWPEGVKLEETLEIFAAAYADVGFEVCTKQCRDLEEGFEKVAVYVDADNVPTHAARQLANGKWTSKLGEWEDIQHDTLEAMEDADGLGLGYGKVALILRRLRP